MKTNCAQVKAIIRQHILDYYTPQELAEQAKCLICNCYPTLYHAVYGMVEGGCFLIYHKDVADFLDSLNINPKGKEYDSWQSWQLYCHLLARDAQLIIKQAATAR